LLNNGLSKTAGHKPLLLWEMGLEKLCRSSQGTSLFVMKNQVDTPEFSRIKVKQF
jgi:hypothetical protein